MILIHSRPTIFLEDVFFEFLFEFFASGIDDFLKSLYSLSVNDVCLYKPIPDQLGGPSRQFMTLLVSEIYKYHSRMKIVSLRPQASLKPPLKIFLP